MEQSRMSFSGNGTITSFIKAVTTATVLMNLSIASGTMTIK